LYRRSRWVQLGVPRGWGCLVLGDDWHCDFLATGRDRRETATHLTRSYRLAALRDARWS
jgi:hypothetical protein